MRSKWRIGVKITQCSCNCYGERNHKQNIQCYEWRWSFLTVALYRDQFYNQFLLNCVPGILSREGLYQNIGIATPLFCTIREWPNSSGNFNEFVHFVKFAWCLGSFFYRTYRTAVAMMRRWIPLKPWTDLPRLMSAPIMVENSFIFWNIF